MKNNERYYSHDYLKPDKKGYEKKEVQKVQKNDHPIGCDPIHSQLNHQVLVPNPIHQKGTNCHLQ